MAAERGSVFNPLWQPSPQLYIWQTQRGVAEWEPKVRVLISWERVKLGEHKLLTRNVCSERHYFKPPKINKRPYSKNRTVSWMGGDRWWSLYSAIRKQNIDARALWQLWVNFRFFSEQTHFERIHVHVMANVFAVFCVVRKRDPRSFNPALSLF